MLKRHLRTTYDMTPEEYRAKWGLPADYPMVAPNYAARRSEFAKQIGLGRKASQEETVVPGKKGKRARAEHGRESRVLRGSPASAPQSPGRSRRAATPTAAPPSRSASPGSGPPAASLRLSAVEDGFDDFRRQQRQAEQPVDEAAAISPASTADTLLGHHQFRVASSVGPISPLMTRSARWSRSVCSRLMMTRPAPACFARAGSPAAG